MTVAELYTYFDTRFPASLSLPWDHDGLQICPDPGREARRVLVSLDVTREAVARAVLKLTSIMSVLARLKSVGTNWLPDEMSSGNCS